MASASKSLNIIVEDNKHCTPCKTKDKKVESQYYCTDCEAYYCDECFELHPRVPYLAKHIVLKHDDIEVWSKLQYKCTTHNKNLEFFCGDHKTLCCHVCVSLKHRSCVGMEYIQESAKNICATDNIKTMIEQTEKELSRIQTYETQIVTKDEVNSKSKAECSVKLEEYTSRLKQMIDLLHNKALEEMSEVFESNKNYCEQITDDLKTFSKELKDLQRQLTTATAEKEVLIFISLKRGEKIVADITQRLSKMDITTDKEKFWPIFDDAVQVYIGNLENIASFEDEQMQQVSDSCESLQQMQEKADCKPVAKDTKELGQYYDTGSDMIKEKVCSYSYHVKNAGEEMKRKIHFIGKKEGTPKSSVANTYNHAKQSIWSKVTNLPQNL